MKGKNWYRNFPKALLSASVPSKASLVLAHLCTVFSCNHLTLVNSYTSSIFTSHFNVFRLSLTLYANSVRAKWFHAGNRIHLDRPYGTSQKCWWWLELVGLAGSANILSSLERCWNSKQEAGKGNNPKTNIILLESHLLRSFWLSLASCLTHKDNIKRNTKKTKT